MEIALYPPMPTRPCRFCLSLQGDSVFADFNVDEDGRVYAVRVSFDCYGCCRAPADVGRMNLRDSQMFIEMVHKGVINPAAAGALRTYFHENRGVLWADALAFHDLL